MSEQVGNNGGNSNETPSKRKPKLNTGEGQADPLKDKSPTGETQERTNSPTGEGSGKSPMGETLGKSPTGDPLSAQLPMGKPHPAQPPSEPTDGPGAPGPHTHATTFGDQTTIIMPESQFRTLMDNVTNDMMNSISIRMDQRFTEQQHTLDQTMANARETLLRGRTQTDYSTLETTLRGRTQADYQTMVGNTGAPHAVAAEHDQAGHHDHFTNPNSHDQGYQPNTPRYADGSTDRKYGNEAGQGGGYGFSHSTSATSRHPDGYTGSAGHDYTGQENDRNRSVWMVKNHSSRASLMPPSKQLFTAMKTMTRKTIRTSLADYRPNYYPN